MKASVDLFKKLPAFSEPELQKEILAHGKIIKANKGDVLIKEGQYLDFLPIVISGTIRVFQKKETVKFCFTETEGEYVLVALAEEMLVGFVSVWIPDNFVHHLYVDEKYHNQNIGTQLLNAVLDKTNAPIRLKCEENNTKAIRFYKQKGFVEKGRGQSEFGTYILFELLKK